MADKALEAKNKGNAAFTAGKYEEAVRHFTEAINYDPNNHILYSNRSGAYASLKQYQQALEDAEKTIEINPNWAKGYGRKGAALHGQSNLMDAIKAYKKGVELEPGNAQLQKGLQDVEAAMEQEAANLFNQPGGAGAGLGGLFRGDVWKKLREHPSTAKFCSQPDFIQLVNSAIANPNALQINDPRMISVLGVLAGIPLQAGDAMETEDNSTPQSHPQPQPQSQPHTHTHTQSQPRTPEPQKPQEPPKEPEPELPENKRLALSEKEKGNDAYKKKDFAKALLHYNTAIDLDPEDITYLVNRSAVFFEQGKYQECLQDCEKAVEEGRARRADYKLIGRAYARMGNTYAKLEDYDNAIRAYNKSLTEHRTADTLTALHKIEKLKSEKERLSYIDPAKSLEAKNEGNEYFKKSLFPEAIKAYTEALKRNPEDHTIYSNRAACYTKLGEFPFAVKDCDECIKLKPDFVKAYIRKGNAQFFMKEYHKSLETYDQGLKYDEKNAELTEGVNKTLAAINRNQGDEQQAARAAQDPEIQGILADPVMRQILNDMQNDPAAAANHMKDPLVATKIQKLVAAGILRLG